MYKRKGSDIWRINIRHDGKKIQKSLKTSNKKLAKTIEAKLLAEIVEGTYYEKLIGRKKTFKDLIDKFLKVHAPKVSDSMQKSYSTSLNHLDPYFGKANLLSITPRNISKYKMLRNDEGAAPATINRELAMLSKAFSLAVKEWEWLKDNPVSKVPREKEDNERDRWLTAGEEVSLLENSPEWLREIILFNLHTGLRQDELLSLTWDRVYMMRKAILIKETKNGKPRTIPLNKIALDILECKAKVLSFKSKIVFHGKAGTKIDKHNLRRAFVIAMERAGIEDFRFHDLRHTFATRLAQSGIDLYKISQLLGHKDIKTTQRYAHHCPDSLRNGVEVLETDCKMTAVAKEAAISG